MKNQWPGRAVMLAAFLLGTACAQAESASAKQAHRYYQDGHYRAAADEYQRLLVKNPNDPRLHYNLGACAFQSGQFDQAAQEFMAATASPDDLNLQQNAWYNHGNAMFRLGEKASEIKDRKNHWMAATNSYATALRLNPNDSDAKHNFEIVKKKLEELEQQQQQQSSSDNKDEKDQQQKEQQDKQEQSKNSQSNQQQQNSGQQEQKNQEQQSSASQNQQQAGQNQPQSGTGQTNQTASASEKGNTNETGQAAQTVQAVMMTPQQAKQLLEAARMEDRILLFMPPEAQKKKNDPHYKNW
jgi:Ca-activated chloride channel family protein